jgi:DNA-binding NarL/FixJ family response regulator
MNEPLPPIRTFTVQQERVIAGIRRGLTYAEIAAEMAIVRDTVDGHVRSIMNILPNPDDLEPRMCIFLYAHYRVWCRSREAA